MQVSGVFGVLADLSWIVLVGAVVGDFLASNDASWPATVNRTAASSWEASSTLVGNEPRGGSALSSLTCVPNGTSALLTSNVTHSVNAGLAGGGSVIDDCAYLGPSGRDQMVLASAVSDGVRANPDALYWELLSPGNLGFFETV
jgi:hypothetical protein